MADLEALIKASIDQATETGEVPEPMTGEEEVDASGTVDPEGSGSGDESGESAEGDEGAEGGDHEDGGAAEAAGAAEGAASVKKPSKEDEEFNAVLKELGINPPDPGKKDNRLPYSRHLRTLVNTVKKDRERLAGEHTKVLGERDAELGRQRTQLDQISAVDQLIATNPEQYLGMLAAMFPNLYGRYVGIKGATTSANDGKPKHDPADPMPQPDQRYEDGTVGYSPEQFAQRDEWIIRQAEKRALEASRKENERLYGPLVRRDQAAELQRQTLEKIRVRVSNAKKVYGEEIYKENEDAIAKALSDDDQSAQRERRAPQTFEAIVASILVPKLQERVNKQREIVTEELRKAPAAASTGKAQGTKPHKSNAEDDRPLEDKMKDAVNAFKSSHGLR